MYPTLSALPAMAGRADTFRVVCEVSLLPGTDWLGFVHSIVCRKPIRRRNCAPGITRPSSSRNSASVTSGSRTGNGSSCSAPRATPGCLTSPISGFVTEHHTSHATSAVDSRRASPTTSSFPPGASSSRTRTRADSTSRWWSTATIVTRSRPGSRSSSWASEMITCDSPATRWDASARILGSRSVPTTESKWGARRETSSP